MQRLRLRGLTRREAEIALLAGRGMRGSEIAVQLQVTPGTVKSLLGRARDRLDCRDRRELAHVLLRDGLVRPDEMFLPGEG